MIGRAEAKQEAALLILREITAIESTPRLSRNDDDNRAIDREIEMIRIHLRRMAGMKP